MKILDIRTMRGPNYWSIRRPKLIVMRLDLEELEDRPTDKIEGFFDRMNALMPSLCVWAGWNGGKRKRGATLRHSLPHTH